MKYVIITLIFMCAVQFPLTYTGIHYGSAYAKSQKQQNTSEKNLLNRIDFGNSYIIGQTIKSGAVYLLQRKKSEIKSMLKYREDYREEILEDFSIIDMKIKQKD
ncbi:MAG: hypothetical protein ACMUJM_19090 [bacterium]